MKKTSSQKGESNRTSTKILLKEMTWPEVEDRLKESDIAVVPVGSTEQHGPALPLNNDAFTAYTLAKTAADEVKEEVKAVITPPVSFGVSKHHMGFPGTITLRPETFRSVIIDVCESLAHHGFKKIVIVNGHGGNVAALKTAISQVEGVFIALMNWWTLTADVIKEVAESPEFHACETETSVALALGQRVDKDKLVKEIPKGPIPKFLKYDLHAEPPMVHTPIDMKRLTKSGVVGNAKLASEKKGKQTVNEAVGRLAEFLRELNSLKLEMA